MNSNIPEILEFLTELKFNNNREWFAANKERYEHIRGLWLDTIGKLIAGVSSFDDSVYGLEPKDCTYRIYRDIRFSHDKTPFKTHLGAVIGKGGKRCEAACYYIHIEPGDCGVYGGKWCPEPELLSRLRHAIDDNFEEFSDIINAPKFKRNFEFTGESLKKLPRGFYKDTPAEKYVKMKEFLVCKQLPDIFFAKDEWIEKVTEYFRYMKPMNDFLNYTIEESAED